MAGFPGIGGLGALSGMLLRVVGGLALRPKTLNIGANLTLTDGPVSGEATLAATGGGSIDASAITSGTVATARLGSGVADNTTFLRGDQSYAVVDLSAKANIASPTFTGIVTAPEFSASGLTGAVSASRYVGATASIAPTTGTFAVGDFVITQTGKIYVCTSAGSPGTWTQVGAGGAASMTIQEVDTSPSVAATTLIFPNDTLVDNGGGSVTYTPVAGVGISGTASIVNSSGGTLTKGTAVTALGGGITSASGPDCGPLRSGNSINTLFGVVNADIADSAAGTVTTWGVVSGLNTSGFTAGDYLYSVSNGGLLGVAGSIPAGNWDHGVGIVLTVHATTGSIYVTSTIDGVSQVRDHVHDDRVTSSGGSFILLSLGETATPDTPDAGYQHLSIDSTTHHLTRKNSSAVVVDLETLGGTPAVATDGIWDAKGDLAAGTGADTAAKLTVGADDTILMADSAQSTGLKWVASQTPSTQAFGDAAAQGTADTYARGDHKHAMPATPSTGLYTAYLCYQDQKSSGTNGGTFTTGAWRTRDLTTEVADTGNYGSLASNQITLAAGTYAVRAYATGFKQDVHQTRLYDITNTALLVQGSTVYNGGTVETSGISVVEGRFTLAGSTVIELQHRGGQTQATNGFGVAGSYGTELYASVELLKES